jgi:hypothetical protein
VETAISGAIGLLVGFGIKKIGKTALVLAAGAWVLISAGDDDEVCMCVCMYVCVHVCMHVYARGCL